MTSVTAEIKHYSVTNHITTLNELHCKTSVKGKASAPMQWTQPSMDVLDYTTSNHLSSNITVMCSFKIGKACGQHDHQIGCVNVVDGGEIICCEAHEEAKA